MIQKNKNQAEEPMQEDAPLDAQLGTEMEELKRDMRSAKITNWFEKNQQQLIVGAVVLLLAMAGVGLWSEKQKTYKESAAMMYFQALAVVDDTQREALLEAVVKDYAATGYGILAHIRLAPLVDTEKNLRAVIENADATPEFRWQAGLDLAEFFITQGKVDESKTLLQEPVGEQYQQLRYSLLAEVSTGEAQKEYLQKALDAISNDAVLKADIETKLAKAGS
ncbi:MAG: tetratricopeptide repeat protein [Mariprofundaceae bacterium]|nr:tetratricopeptide repeat protein [Mariprofundaceae bacterium]